MGVAKLGKKSVVKKLFLVKSQAEFDDSIFNGFIPYQEKKETFLQKKAYTAAKMPFDNPFTVIMQLANEEKVFKRKVYSLLDMIGDIGGLYDGLLFITGFFLSTYN